MCMYLICLVCAGSWMSNNNNNVCNILQGVNIKIIRYRMSSCDVIDCKTCSCLISLFVGNKTLCLTVAVISITNTSHHTAEILR